MSRVEDSWAEILKKRGKGDRMISWAGKVKCRGHLKGAEEVGMERLKHVLRLGLLTPQL